MNAERKRQEDKLKGVKDSRLQLRRSRSANPANRLTSKQHGCGGGVSDCMASCTATSESAGGLEAGAAAGFISWPAAAGAVLDSSWPGKKPSCAEDKDCKEKGEVRQRKEKPGGRHTESNSVAAGLPPRFEEDPFWRQLYDSTVRDSFNAFDRSLGPLQVSFQLGFQKLAACLGDAAALALLPELLPDAPLATMTEAQVQLEEWAAYWELQRSAGPLGGFSGAGSKERGIGACFTHLKKVSARAERVVIGMNAVNRAAALRWLRQSGPADLRAVAASKEECRAAAQNADLVPASSLEGCLVAQERVDLQREGGCERRTVGWREGV
jgi:hypothetical protein